MGHNSGQHKALWYSTRENSGKECSAENKTLKFLQYHSICNWLEHVVVQWADAV